MIREGGTVYQRKRARIFPPKLPWFFLMNTQTIGYFEDLQRQAKNRMQLLGVGSRKYLVKRIEPGHAHLLLKVTPEWFVSCTTVRLGEVKFTSTGKVTVSLFVCPAGFTPLSWLTMLMGTNWDTTNGWMMDRYKDVSGKTHVSIPTSTQDSYQLGPDEAVYIVNGGACAITDIDIDLVLPTYETITSNVRSLSDHLPRLSQDQVTHDWAMKRAAERSVVNLEIINKLLERGDDHQIKQVAAYIHDEIDYDESESE